MKGIHLFYVAVAIFILQCIVLSLYVLKHFGKNDPMALKEQYAIEYSAGRVDSAKDAEILHEFTEKDWYEENAWRVNDTTGKPYALSCGDGYEFIGYSAAWGKGGICCEEKKDGHTKVCTIVRP